MTKLAYCANCQEEKFHAAEVDQNGDLVMTCDCGRFIKLPADTAAEEVSTVLDEHKSANDSQIKIEDQLIKFGLEEPQKPAKK